jgi:hypothetical protein
MSAEECIAVFTEWAKTYPASRFMVISISADFSDAQELGWGLALPDHVFTYLPAISFTGRFSSAARLLRVLNVAMDVRLIWLDPEPEPYEPV